MRPTFIDLRLRRAWQLALAAATCLALQAHLASAEPPRAITKFLASHCIECHDSEMKKGGLDLTALPWDPTRTRASRDWNLWVQVHDKVSTGEMPPPQRKNRPSPKDSRGFTNALGTELLEAEQRQTARVGRSIQRRLNRYEYEDTLRDLLSLPYLEVRNFLPEDSEAHGYNKIGEALDVSHVQMSRYLGASDFALRKAMAPRKDRPETQTKRYYAWDQGEFFGSINLAGPRERRTIPMVGLEARRDLMSAAEPKREPEPSPEIKQRQAMGVVVSTYEPTEIRFGRFRAPVSGRYKLTVSAYSFWIDPKFTNVTRGRRDEPVTLYSDSSPRILRKLGGFDVRPDPTVNSMEVWLLAGETIRPDAARLHRSRPPDHKNPLTVKDGMPGVAFQWLEVEGPLVDQWPPPGHKLLFGDLPMEDAPTPSGVGRSKISEGVRVRSVAPERDAERLLRGFLRAAYRRPVDESELSRFLGVVKGALDKGHDFTESMLAGYTAVLSSPGFLYFSEPKAGRLDDLALAERLAYFLWNSAPDSQLRTLAENSTLHRPAVLRAQTERLLNDPRSRRFVNAFLDYWLDLRVIADTAPDTELYPDYQLDDLLVESMSDETQLFFAEMLRRDLAITNLVDSNFTFLNERLAQHYDLEDIHGIQLRPVTLPRESVRGGLLTQASVLKVTANGTTTSPVKRGAWIMGRILGSPPPAPPPSVPAVEPDIRGATTIREQLAKHRTLESCNACHRRIDPVGFALENFDVMGGWRSRYRSVGTGDPVKGIGHNGLFFHFSQGPSVDASGELLDGTPFKDILELKKCLIRDDRQLARNLARQLAVYATGSPIRFADRPAIEKILTKTRAQGYGARSLVHELVQSDLFLNK